MIYDNKLVETVRQSLGSTALFVGSVVPRNSRLIMLLFLTTVGIVKVQTQAQGCLTDAINTGFQNNQGYIGLDSVKTVSPVAGEVYLGNGGTNFELFLNGAKQTSGSCAFNAGDDIVIKPMIQGTEPIDVLSSGPGCPSTRSEPNTAMAPVLPVTRAGVPSVEPIGDRRYRVKFATSKEWGNSHFTIEGITEGDTSYQNLAITPSLAVDGNSDARHDYSVEFDAPEGMYYKRIYIRIRQTDKDGTSAVNTGDDPSILRPVWLGGPDDLLVFPNPVPAGDPINRAVPEGFITDEDEVYYRLINVSTGQIAAGGLIDTKLRSGSVYPPNLQTGKYEFQLVHTDGDKEGISVSSSIIIN